MVEIAGRVNKNFNSSIGSAQKKLGGFSNILKKVSIAAAAAFAVKKGAEFFGDAINTYSEFQQATTNAAALAGATAEQYAAMEAAAMEAGKRTTKTAAEASEALGYMALAGWDVETSIAALMPVLRLSEATQMDLATASDLVTDSMSALGIAQNDLAHYLDVATIAGARSNQTTQQMMEAYIEAGQSLDDLGISVEDYSTALGVLANRGKKGSEAGTAVKAIVTNIKKEANALKKIGVEVYDAQGNFNGLTAVLESVNRVTAGYNQQQKDALYLSIAGKNHVGSFNKIMAGLNTTTEDGVSEWEALNNALYQSDGALDAMANTMTDTIEGAQARFASAVDNLKIQLGKRLSGPTKKAIDKAAEMLNRFTDGAVVSIDKLSAFLEKHKEALPYIATFAGSLASLIAAHKAFNLVSTKGAALAAGFGKVIGFLASPVGIAVVAISALITAGVLLYKNWDTVKAKAQELWEKITTCFGGIKDSIIGAFEDAKQKVAGFFSWLDEKISSTPILGSIYGGVKFVGSKLMEHPVPAMASGGIVTAPTLSMIGEGGEPEAVMPLSKLERMLDGISSGGGGKIIFAPKIEIKGNADKKEVANAVRISFEEFKRMMEKYEREKRRVAF